MGRLSGKVAVVTGIGPGNGSAIARLFASEGADLALLSLETPALADTVAAVERMGRRVIVIEGDVGLRPTWDRARELIKEQLGGPDVVVNNAATANFVHLFDLSESVFDATLRTNLKSALFSFQTFIPGMVERGGGVFVNISSVNGLVANPNFVDYATSKSALHGMTRNVALDFGRKGIRANCIAPGAIFSTVTEAKLDEEEARTIRDNYPLGRWGEPADVAKAALFLASSESAFITGIILPVDGGLTIHTPEAAVRKSFRALWRDDALTIHEAPK
jgi:NAD(P)-dependent dehydrogenase (short-subunit alcohol dehydrogenase family)